MYINSHFYDHLCAPFLGAQNIQRPPCHRYSPWSGKYSILWRGKFVRIYSSATCYCLSGLFWYGQIWWMVIWRWVHPNMSCGFNFLIQLPRMWLTLSQMFIWRIDFVIWQTEFIGKCYSQKVIKGRHILWEVVPTAIKLAKKILTWLCSPVEQRNTSFFDVTMAVYSYSCILILIHIIYVHPKQSPWNSLWGINLL